MQDAAQTSVMLIRGTQKVRGFTLRTCLEVPLVDELKSMLRLLQLHTCRSRGMRS